MSHIDLLGSRLLDAVLMNCHSGFVLGDYCYYYYYGIADSPEARVQNFRGMRQQTRSIVLEWLPPQRSDVTRYRVRVG